MSGRLANFGRKIRRTLLWLVVAFVAIPAIQCFCLNFVDPPVTLTMIGSVLDWHEIKGSWRLFRHDSIGLEDMACGLPRAAVSSEDGIFFQHHGFDFRAIDEALGKYRSGGKITGASTISQQVARNVFLWQKRSWLRKGLEAWYTVWLEILVPKRRILEVYLNIAESGPLTFGVQAGARLHYGKRASQLTDAEAASIVALFPSPRKWRPTGSTVQKRVAWILSNPAPVPGDIGCLQPR